MLYLSRGRILPPRSAAVPSQYKQLELFVFTTQLYSSTQCHDFTSRRQNQVSCDATTEQKCSLKGAAGEAASAWCQPIEDPCPLECKATEQVCYDSAGLESCRPANVPCPVSCGVGEVKCSGADDDGAAYAFCSGADEGCPHVICFARLSPSATLSNRLKHRSTFAG